MHQEALDNLSKIGNKKTCPVAVFVKDRKILCGLRHYDSDKWKKISVWTFPGGRCDENETLHQTLVREIKEEIGITKFNVLKYVGEVAGAKEEDIVPIFICETNQFPKLMEPHKFSEWQWFLLSEFPKNFINNEAKNSVEKFLQQSQN